MTATLEPEVGKSRRRKEDARLITGRTRWTDNLTLPGLVHMAILRSPMAHARITGIDTSAAKEMPGVVAVLTGADLADEQGSLPCAWPITEDMKSPPAPSIAVDTVNFAGEAVAVVIARSAYEAADALESIDVDYDELPVVLDMNAAVADGADLVHPDLGSNASATWIFDSGEAGTGSDVEQAISRRRGADRAHLPPAAADPGLHGAPLGDGRPDRRADDHVVGHPDPAHPAPDARDDAVRPRAQGPRDRAGRRRRVRRQAAGHAGGGARPSWSARRLGKPVKYTESRSESLLSGHHGRDQIQKLTLAATRDGTVTGLKVELLADMGAYLRLVTPGVPILGAFMYNAIYKFPAYRFTCTNVFTNKIADRRLPRRGPPGGDLRDRADDGRAGRRARHGPDGAPREELDHPRGVPVHHRRAG